MSAIATRNAGIAAVSEAVKPPGHPTYDLKSVIQLALSEDAGDIGNVTCKGTIPVQLEVEAHFLTKKDGIVAGISLAEIVFNEVDPSLKVLIVGGQNHRMGLFDMVMIKDNHISIAGGVTKAEKSVDLYLE